MTKTLSMVSHKNNYNLNANEGFVIFLTSKLVTWFIGSFTLKMKSQSIAYLLNGSEHMYWIWNLEDEVHSIWDLWVIKRPSRMQEQWFFQNRTDGKKTVFNRILKILIFWTDGCPCPNLRPKKNLGGGGETYHPPKTIFFQAFHSGPRIWERMKERRSLETQNLELWIWKVKNMASGFLNSFTSGLVGGLAVTLHKLTPKNLWYVFPTDY